ncbi:MAG: helix-turn-helix domain-containing protein [bacterium]|nr:AraC family transcriptional regulator [Gammaproteobacteria bacterium]HIL97777.1 AraC family transcriptional regulator [Pseudomonadales bacterium]
MRAVEFVESYFDAWNHRDAQSVGDHLSKDGKYFDIPDQTLLTHDELVKTLADSFYHENNHYELVGEIATGENTVAFQYKVSSANPDIDEGIKAPWFGAEFIVLDGDFAIRIDDYYEISGSGQAGPSKAIQQKYAKSGLSDEQLERYKNQLTSLMQSEQAYLNPDLTLPKLALLVECPVNHLSQVINSGFNMSFFDYLNHYRIKDAKKLLCLEDGQLQAILSIAFEVGFNSNSAFYAAFKKSCGRTPAQFRQAQAGEI